MKYLSVLIVVLFFAGCADEITNNNNGGSPADFDIYLVKINSQLMRFETYTIKSDGTGFNLFNDSLAVGCSSPNNRILMGKIDATGFSYSAVYSAKYDGSSMVSLPITGYYPVFFDLTLNGEQALFTTDDGNYLFVVNTDGTGLLQLSDGIRGTESVPKFSPDGKRIAFFEAPPNLQTGLYLINANGTGKKLLKDSIFYSNGFTLDWSPDGSRIIYQNKIGNGNESKICVIDTSGSLYNELTVGENPLWSPNGNKISYLKFVGLSAHDLHIMNPDGTGTINISNSASVYESPGRWSRDGTKLLYSAQTLPFDFKIKIYDTGSGNTHTLIDSLNGAIWR